MPKATKLGCEHVTPNHSKDRVKVFSGGDEPIILCGYHATCWPVESLNPPRGEAVEMRETLS